LIPAEKTEISNCHLLSCCSY